MSLTTIPNHFQTDFEQLWIHNLQQKPSKLAGAVTMTTCNGKERRFSFLSEGDMSVVSVRNGPTTPDDSTTNIRWLRTTPYQRTTWIDEFDDIALGELNAPTSEHVQQHTWAWNRTQDSIIRDALEGNAITGTAGTTLTALGSGRTVAVNYKPDGTTADSNMTLGKLIQAKYLLDVEEVDMDGRYIAMDAAQLRSMLNSIDQVNSSDYNNVKALIEGSITRFMGFNFIVYNGLTKDANNIRNVLAWHKDFLYVARPVDRKVSLDILPTQSHTLQIRTRGLMGALRRQEEGVVLIKADEDLN